MSKLKVTLRNMGGALDTRVVQEEHKIVFGKRVISPVEEEAASAAIGMIREAGELHPGDSIVIVENDE